MESIAERTMYVYEQLLQREIPNRDAEFNCGRSWLEAERPELAEEVFRRLMESGYQVTESRFRLSQSLFAQQRYVEAKQELIKLLQDEPEHEEALEFFQEFQDHVNRGQAKMTTTEWGHSMCACVNADLVGLLILVPASSARLFACLWLLLLCASRGQNCDLRSARHWRAGRIVLRVAEITDALLRGEQSRAEQAARRVALWRHSFGGPKRRAIRPTQLLP
jgi:tetratricopeptide (TPR) repeat protein